MSITVPLEGFGGGGNPLNFRVKSYATEEERMDTAPKENTIGIITEQEITGWVLSATVPETPVEGMVHINTGTEGDVAFNALKKNGIQVYPWSASQYVDGAWAEVPAYLYQNGEWDEVYRKVWLIRDGIYDATNVVGFTYTKLYGNDFGENCGISQGNGYLETVANAVSNSSVGGKFTSAVSVPSKKYNTLQVEIEAEIGSADTCAFQIGGSVYQISQSLSRRIISLDISQLDNDYPLELFVAASATGSWTCKVRYYNAWLI